MCPRVQTVQGAASKLKSALTSGSSVDLNSWQLGSMVSKLGGIGGSAAGLASLL